MPNWILAARQIGEHLLSEILPQTCFICGGPSGAIPVCEHCFVELPPAPDQCCPVCALDSPMGEICGACLLSPPSFDATHALHPYAFPVRELIHALKFNAYFGVVNVFKEALTAAANQFEVDCVVPVPVHPARLAERGFNQAALLAKPVARALRRPLLLRAIVKDKLAPPQAGLDRDGRLRNLKGAFRAVQRFDGACVLVVDDVMTSGSTLNEVAIALRAAGAQRVENLVVARTLAAGTSASH